MEAWSLVNRIVVQIYCIIRYVGEGMTNTSQTVFMLLIYICADMLAHIVRRKILKQMYLLLSIVILCVFSVFTNGLFLLPVVVDAGELVLSFTDNKKIMLPIMLAPIIFCSRSLYPEYILVSLLSFIVFLLSARLSDANVALMRINERFREKRDELDSHIEAGIEYENQVRYLTQLEERNNLAQNIHDKIGHTIAGSIIQLQAATVLIDKDKEKAASIIEDTAENLRNGMSSIRSTLRSIKPASEQLGINRLKLMVEELSLKSSIKTSFTYKGDLEKIKHSHWRIITDNIKEALTNSIKYSHATKIDVELEVLNKMIKAQVKDNGIGSRQIKKGLGIMGMEERAEGAGGNLIIDGTFGFCVITLLPIEER